MWYPLPMRSRLSEQTVSAEPACCGSASLVGSHRGRDIALGLQPKALAVGGDRDVAVLVVTQDEVAGEAGEDLLLLGPLGKVRADWVNVDRPAGACGDGGGWV